MMRSSGPKEGLLGFSAEKYIPVRVCGLVGAFALVFFDWCLPLLYLWWWVSFSSFL